MRLIDANWVFGHLKPYEPSDEKWSVTGGTALRLIHDAVNNAPTIDAVPIIRCKNCANGMESGDNKYIICCMLGVGMEFDDFCSHGERKGESSSDTIN